MSTFELRTGIDLVDCRRLQRMLDADASFLDIAFTKSEQTYCAGDVARLAARWGAKEAAMKALGLGIGDISPRDVEVLVDPKGAPTLNLTGSAFQRSIELGVSGWQITLSHESDFAIAFVIAVIGGDGV